jgi:hypothetical protein
MRTIFGSGLSGLDIMDQEHDYVTYFYEKYDGRVAIGVGYDQSLSEIYPCKI